MSLGYLWCFESRQYTYRKVGSSVSVIGPYSELYQYYVWFFFFYGIGTALILMHLSFCEVYTDHIFPYMTNNRPHLSKCIWTNSLVKIYIQDVVLIKMQLVQENISILWVCVNVHMRRLANVNLSWSASTRRTCTELLSLYMDYAVKFKSLIHFNCTPESNKSMKSNQSKCIN